MDRRVLVVNGDLDSLPEIYDDVKAQFPENCVHSLDHFQFLLQETSYRMMILQQESDGKMIGYCLSYLVMGTGVVWLDYIAIRRAYQASGYGNLLLRVVLSAYREFADGLLFMLEKPGRPDDVRRLDQERRVDFYKRLGARRLHTDFYLPAPQGACSSMDLFFMPITNDYNLSARKQKDTLKVVYGLMFRDIDRQTRKQCEERTQPSIVDEKF